MASTYPLEIVQVSRWSKANGDKGGEKAGNLKSNEQQTVVTQGDSIVIQPAQPQVMYVPAYNPTVVYGTWPYPPYPPTYYPGVAAWYPGQSFVNGLMWGTGVVAASAMFGSFNWGSRSVDISVNNYNRYSRNNFYNTSNNRWGHDPQHRGAVAYRDPGARQQFSNRIPGTEARQAFRGRGNSQDGPRGQLGDKGPHDWRVCINRLASQIRRDGSDDFQHQSSWPGIPRTWGQIPLQLQNVFRPSIRIRPGSRWIRPDNPFFGFPKH